MRKSYLITKILAFTQHNLDRTFMPKVATNVLLVFLSQINSINLCNLQTSLIYIFMFNLHATKLISIMCTGFVSFNKFIQPWDQITNLTTQIQNISIPPKFPPTP